MKTILILFSTILLGLTPATETVINNDIFNETLTFDAYEGGYFFFTDSQELPLILVIDSKSSMNSKILIENEVAGNKFKVRYKAGKKLKNDSSEGTIIHIEPLK